MYFINSFVYFTAFILIYLPTTKSISNKHLNVIKSGVGPLNPESIGINFYAVVNNTSNDDFVVELLPDKCCIYADNDLDCESLKILGDCIEIIPGQTTRSLKLVAPTSNPLERKGYCLIHVDSRPVDKIQDIMRNNLKIKFDTTQMDNEFITSCNNTDKDPFNNCTPVNCDYYYNGVKPYYSAKVKRCIHAKECAENQIYDEGTNNCKETVVSDADLDKIKALSLNRPRKSLLIIKTVKKPETHSKDNVCENEVVPKKISLKSKLDNAYMKVLRFFIDYKYSMLLGGIIIVLQCCLLLCLLMRMRKTENCEPKKVVQKYFNDKQDASVTTPLITMTNIDTETSLNYVSETSTNDRKFKTYMSCQRVQETQPKVSMSDDIIAKYLSRRDWVTKPPPETVNYKADLKDYKIDIKEITPNNQDVKAENAMPKKYDIDEDISEKEILCHNYNVSAIDTQCNKVKPIPEKGAQASFSNDSVDDFLSERGILIFGEDISKYSFSNTSQSTTSTSKTSKNNILKHFLSFISKKSRRTNSEPGKPRSDSGEMQILHISQASIHSSSESNMTKNLTNGKIVHQSRSTL